MTLARCMPWMALALCVGCGSPATQTVHPTLAARRTPVDIYLPEDEAPAPLVVVAHGFARSRHRMEGWGTALAGEGFVVAVPNMPYFAKHHDNAQAVVELVDEMRASHGERLSGELGLVGFSAGGLATAVAAERRGDVGVWVGLDPVDAGGSATSAAASLSIPGIALFAEPSGCNADNNGHAVRDAWSGPLLSARVIGATHCDPERPSNASCAWFCGRSDPERADAFLLAASSALKAALRCDEAALDALASLDDRFAEVEGSFVATVREACAVRP
ncbi:MAG: hypothetical protein EP330_10325 [Deltaproteobacteria bacterium]|nr:MAG: hypothetical protein EP330_10325 [Deltaproteobacteria bacterium]